MIKVNLSYGYGKAYLLKNHSQQAIFYEKMGFEIVAEEDIPIGDYFMNDYVMRKPL